MTGVNTLVKIHVANFEQQTKPKGKGHEKKTEQNLTLYDACFC